MGARRPDSQRVVVTGMGAVTPIGDTVATFWSALVAGRSGIGRWKRPIDERCYARIGGDLSDFDLAAHLQRQTGYAPALVKRCLALMRTAPLVPNLVAAAALQAFHDAGLAGSPASGRVGHVMAGHNVNAGYIVQNALTFHQTDPDYIEPLFGLHSLDTDVLASCAEMLSLHGPCFTVGGACASGNLAMLAALDLVRAGRADAVLVSGAPIELEPVALHGWTMLEALSYRSFNDAPERASRPFDGRREGFVPSEGAGALVLERLDGARARGARVHAELLGASATSDACRLTRPNLDGQADAMRMALDDAGVDPGEIDYVNAHATSTRLGDAVEAAAIGRALGGRARAIPVNATKSMIGHCLSAAGVVEAVATVLQLTHGIVHPTINQEETDPEIDLDVVPNRARPAALSVALSNSFGFGGLNSSVVLGRFTA
ncbi:MAG: beta-ketoacyl synthase [Vicinamibacterales bacterium]